MTHKALQGSIVAVLVALALWACLWRGTGVSLIGLGGAMLILALCQFVVLGYLSALRRAHDLRLFRAAVWWRGLVSGHGLRLVGALAWSLWSGLCIALALVAQPGPTLAGAALIGLALPALVRRFGGWVDPSVIAGQRDRFVIRPAILIAGLAAVVLSALWRVVPGDLAQMVVAQIRYTGSSALLGQMIDAYALALGMGGVLRGAGLPGLLLALLLEVSVWMGIATAMAAVLVPGQGIARIIAPDGPPGVPALVVTGFLPVILIVGLVSLAAALEQQVQVMLAQSTDVLTAPDLPAGTAATLLPAADDRPGPIALVPMPSDLRQAVEREQIGTLLCPPGTVAALTAFETRMQGLLADETARVTAAVQSGFAGMRANVPVFLDWYYSLSAEYLRVLNLVAGNGEAYLSGRVDALLGTGDPFQRANADIAGLAEVAGRITDEIARGHRAILAECRLALPRDDAAVTVIAARPAAGLDLPVLMDRIAFADRAAAAGFGGLAAGIGVAVLAKVGAKVAVGTLFKTAAAALVKIAGSKALTFLGGVGLGAAAGGAGGSVVPGAGTTAGALLGGLVGGVAVMVGVDFTLIKLEEEISRAGFEAEIIAAIDATEAEFLAVIGGAPDAGAEPEMPGPAE